ncbi:S26 family signal peptidase [Parasulfuritortus cantonensis]|nr:S26 family signal peptidase [Parasulfuritortus cantonensis]
MACPHPIFTRAPRGRIYAFLAWLGREALALLLSPLRYWPATLIIVPVLVWTAMHYRFNLSPSLPWTVARVEYGRTPARGEYMLYTYRGPIEGLPSHTFFKRVAGIPGDTILVDGRRVWVAGRLVGEAAEHTHKGVRLTTIRPGTIPDGFLFAQGDHPASFDSRYAESGLVPFDAVIGVAHPVF